jgi:hypothetical protein
MIYSESDGDCRWELAMTLQSSSAASSLLKVAPWGFRLRSSIAPLLRAAWGAAAGVLFILAFPLAIVLAPLLWAIGKVRGEPDLD